MGGPKVLKINFGRISDLQSRLQVKKNIVGQSRSGQGQVVKIFTG
jgi:hypothetical protein